MTVQEDLNLSDYDRVRQQIQTKEKNELEERIKKQQELERKRAFDLLNSNYISQNESKTQQPSAHVEVPTSSIQPPPHPTNPPYHAPSYPPHPSHPYPPAPYYYPSPPTYPAPTYPPYSGYPPYPAPYPSPYHPYAAPKYPPGPISPLGPMAPLNQYPKYPGYPDPKNAMYRPPVPYGQPGQMEPFPYRYTSPESVPSSVPPVRQDDSGTIAQMQPRPIENIVKKPIDETSNIICLENFLKTEDLVEDEEYLYTYDDIKNELSNYGTVDKLIIPRPNDVKPNAEGKSKYNNSSLLKVYCKYKTNEEAKAAIKAMSTKAFDNNLVKATYYSFQKFDSSILD